jgi:hypothetical protein
VRGAQQGGIGDAGNRAAASPIINQRGAKDVLADALEDEPFGFGSLRQVGGLCAKPGERGVWEADAELVGAVERGMERGQGVEFEGGEARPAYQRGWQGRKLCRDTRVINRKNPRAARWRAGNTDLTACGGRCVASQPPRSTPRSSRNPLSQVAFCASVRTTKPGGSSGAIMLSEVSFRTVSFYREAPGILQRSVVNE